METEIVGSVAEATMEPEKGVRRKPRGYASLQRRLLKALKQGASINGLLGQGHTDVGYRVRDGRGVQRSNLKMLADALDRWEKSEPIRMRAVRRTMRKPVKKAARSIVPVPAATSPDFAGFAGALWIIETFTSMPREVQVRVHAILHAMVEE